LKAVKSYTIIVSRRFAMLALTAIVLGSMTVGIVLAIALPGNACERQCVQRLEQQATEAKKARNARWAALSEQEDKVNAAKAKWDQEVIKCTAVTMTEQDKAIVEAVGWTLSKKPLPGNTPTSSHLPLGKRLTHPDALPGRIWRSIRRPTADPLSAVHFPQKKTQTKEIIFSEKNEKTKLSVLRAWP
jgi:hypothetical protein